MKQQAGRSTELISDETAPTTRVVSQVVRRAAFACRGPTAEPARARALSVAQEKGRRQPLATATAHSEGQSLLRRQWQR